MIFEGGMEVYVSESFEFTVEFPVYPERVYRAWLDGGEISQITGQAAQIEDKAGGKFSIMDGQVTGEILTASPHDHIVQTWKMANMPETDEEMKIDLAFEPTCTGTEMVLTHYGVPDGRTREAMAWWDENFLHPMRAYFDEIVGEYVADMGDG